MGQPGPELLGRLFDEHANALALYARQWCDTPEDVVQDAFVSLARQRVLPGRVVPWLYTVVRHAAIDVSRRARRLRRLQQRAASGASDGGAESWFESADDRIDAARASELLAGLDVESREAIVARVWGGLTFEEIARLQGCSLTTAHRRYHDGLARLQERLGTS
jgi:RNA polymerase sigma-70 factor (ECF subfamily)